jgi:hypothetical protein
MNTKTVTVADILDAMEKNGFKQSRESWITFNKDGSVQKACALGQAVINLEVDLSAFQAAILSWGLRDNVIELNDHKKLSCKEIAVLMRNKWDYILDQRITLLKREYKIKN